jgi:hypothetical protein
MAKFKRFDPENRKVNHDKFRREYSERQNDYIKRKTEYDNEKYYGNDELDEDKKFQPQRTGVRL